MVQVGKMNAVRLVALAPVALLMLLVLLAQQVQVQLIRDAGGIPKDAEGLQGFIKTCNALVTSCRSQDQPPRASCVRPS